ncbi:MAG: sulfatase-like hydrolase/transferase, partial [Holophagales bacterium]|nr:sulfatase-like hydrolase/transferase [Holophagales bacterium]
MPGTALAGAGTVVALVALLLSCRPASESDASGILLRFIDGDLGSTRGGLDVYREEQVFRWSFRSQELVSHWRPGNLDIAFRQQGFGLFMRSSTRDPFIVREGLDIDADEVDTVRIRHSWIDSSLMQIFWAGSKEKFTEGKSLKIEGVENRGLLEPTYAFDVRSHPGWTGRIGRFRLDPTMVPERRLMVFWIEGVKRVLDADKLAAAIATPGAIDLAGDSRLALVAPTGYVHERSLVLPEGAHLETAVGLIQTQGEAVTFRVSVEHGGKTEEVYSRTLDPATDGGRWFRERIPLPASAGQDATLRLVTEGPAPEDQRHGLPAWAHPEVVGPEAPGPDGPNVVLILLDTLRADRMSLYGHDAATTPRLERWAAERAVVFENAVAPSPWTLPSHASLFTGLDSVRHGSNYGDAV